MDERSLDMVFGALSDRTRRAILLRLAEGPSNVTDLAKPFDMSLPAISKHLKVLEKTGLLNRDRDGRVHRCSLQPKPMDEASDWIGETRRFWQGRLDRLEQYLLQREKQGGTDYESGND